MIILFTSALIKDYSIKREEEYTNSFKALDSFGYKEKTHILECVSDGEEGAFLNKLTNKVFYSKKKYTFKNKGVNEILNIKHFLESIEIPEDEIIVKLTGRYLFLDNRFLNECEKGNFDVLYKKDYHNQIFFGCVAARKKVISNFINDIDWMSIENDFISIEKVFADYVFNKDIIKKEIDFVNIKCNINNSDLHIL